MKAMLQYIINVYTCSNLWTLVEALSWLLEFSVWTECAVYKIWRYEKGKRTSEYLCPTHTSGRRSLAICIGQPARLQHFEHHHIVSVLVGRYKSLVTNDQKYVLAIMRHFLHQRPQSAVSDQFYPGYTATSVKEQYTPHKNKNNWWFDDRPAIWNLKQTNMRNAFKWVQTCLVLDLIGLATLRTQIRSRPNTFNLPLEPF